MEWTVYAILTKACRKLQGFLAMAFFYDLLLNFIVKDFDTRGSHRWGTAILERFSMHKRSFFHSYFVVARGWRQKTRINRRSREMRQQKSPSSSWYNLESSNSFAVKQKYQPALVLLKNHCRVQRLIWAFRVFWVRCKPQKMICNWTIVRHENCSPPLQPQLVSNPLQCSKSQRKAHWDSAVQSYAEDYWLRQHGRLPNWATNTS
jgi:hypothetical protein